MKIPVLKRLHFRSQNKHFPVSPSTDAAAAEEKNPPQLSESSLKVLKSRKIFKKLPLRVPKKDDFVQLKVL